MKKVIYTFALLAILAASFSSCTEDVVKPKETSNTGGNVSTGCAKC